MARLFDLIMRDRKIDTRLKDGLKDGLRGTTVIVADNVAEYFGGRARGTDGIFLMIFLTSRHRSTSFLSSTTYRLSDCCIPRWAFILECLRNMTKPRAA